MALNSAVEGQNGVREIVEQMVAGADNVLIEMEQGSRQRPGGMQSEGPSPADELNGGSSQMSVMAGSLQSVDLNSSLAQVDNQQRLAAENADAAVPGFMEGTVDRRLTTAWTQTTQTSEVKRRKHCHFIELYVGQNYQDKISLLTRAKIKGIPRLIRVISQTAMSPPTYLGLEVNALLLRTETDTEQLLKLLQAVAPLVTVLSIYNLNHRIKVDPEVTKFPALRNLELRFWPVEKISQRKWNLNFALGIVMGAPNLENLSLEGDRLMDEFVDVMDTLNGRKIKCLFLKSVVEHSHITRLTAVGLQLKSLCIEFPCVEAEKFVVSTGNIKTFLRSQSAHLKSLELWGPCGDEFFGMTIKFPRMEKLKNLKVFACGDSFIDFERINYATQFPVLKRLKLNVGNPDMITTFINANMQPVTSVEKLKLWAKIENPGVILHVARQFPNLRMLLVQPTNSLLTSVGQALPNLEELELFFDNEDEDEVKTVDSFLTGYSTEAFEELQNMSSRELEVLERNREPPQFLKNLKKLIMTASEGKLRVTDFACRVALLKMERLELLEFFNAPQVSAQTMEEMQRKFTVKVTH